MTVLEQSINLHFGIPKDDISKIADFFTTETIAKGDFFAKQAERATSSVL
ncbi:MAG: hypothetical protein M0D57_16815 [Sphingobacteriales bacterium JAD_PAG50586_3]|nr:MAG: hypothetical protein M0D57_16815 [Sphingobacteriales bacterium JAD_PAG50586_3]